MMDFPEFDPEKPPATEWTDGAGMVEWFKANYKAACWQRDTFQGLAIATGDPEAQQAAIDWSDIAVQYEADLVVAEYVVRVASADYDDLPF